LEEIIYVTLKNEIIFCGANGSEEDLRILMYGTARLTASRLCACACIMVPAILWLG